MKLIKIFFGGFAYGGFERINILGCDDVLIIKLFLAGLACLRLGVEDGVL